MSKWLVNGFIVSIVLCSNPSIGFAVQDPSFNLQDAISLGLKDSLDLNKVQAYNDLAHAKATGALTEFLPTIWAKGSYSLTNRYQYNDITLGATKSHVPVLFPTSTGEIDFSIPLFDGFSNIDRYRAAQLRSEASDANLSWQEFKLAQEIRIYFNRALAAKQLEAVAQQNRTTLNEHLEQIKKLKNSGVATQYDVLRVEVQLNESQAELIRAQDEVVISMDRLFETLGVPTRAVELTGDLEIPSDSLIQTVQGSTLANSTLERPDLKSLEISSRASHLTARSSSRYWAPRFSIGGQYLLYNNQTTTLSDWDKYRAAWNLGLYMTIPIFDGFKSNADAKEAWAKEIEAEKSETQERLKATHEFEMWKRRYLYNASLFASKKSDIEKSLETVRLAQAGYRAGVRTSTDVLDAELDLFRARAGAVRAQMDCSESRIRLELALGKRI